MEESFWATAFFQGLEIKIGYETVERLVDSLRTKQYDIYELGNLTAATVRKWGFEEEDSSRICSWIQNKLQVSRQGAHTALRQAVALGEILQALKDLKPEWKSPLDQATQLPVSKKMPWVGRTQLLEDLGKEVWSNINEYADDERTKQLYNTWILYGALGVGKTRTPRHFFLEVLPTFKDRNFSSGATFGDLFKSQVHICLEFARAEAIDRDEAQQRSSAVLGLRTAARFFFNQRASVLASLLTESQRKQFLFSEVVIEIGKECKKKEKGHLLLLLQLDEFSYLSDEVLKEMQTAIGDALTSDPFSSGVCLIPMWTGVSHGPKVAKIFQPSRINPILHLITALSHKEAVETLKSSLPTNSSFAESVWFEWLVESTGQIPRFLQFVSKELIKRENSSQATKENFRDVFREVVTRIERAYMTTSWKEFIREKDGHGLPRFCLWALSQQPVRMTDKVNGITLAELNATGIVFLKEVPGEYIALFPLLLLAALNASLGFLEADCLNPFIPTDPERFEWIAMTARRLRNVLLLELGQTEATYEELYPGALGLETTRSRKVSLPKLSPTIYHAKGSSAKHDSYHKFKLQEIPVHEEMEPINLESGNYLVLNVQRASSSDGIAFHPATASTEASVEHIQMKSSDAVHSGENAQEALTMEQLKAEWNLVSDAKHMEFHASREPVLVVISNKPLKDFARIKDYLASGNTRHWPEGLLVVCAENFSRFAGALAHRSIHKPRLSRTETADSLPVGAATKIDAEVCTCDTRCAKKNLCICRYWASFCTMECHKTSTKCTNTPNPDSNPRSKRKREAKTTGKDEEEQKKQAAKKAKIQNAMPKKKNTKQKGPDKEEEEEEENEEEEEVEEEDYDNKDGIEGPERSSARPLTRLRQKMLISQGADDNGDNQNDIITIDQMEEPPAMEDLSFDSMDVVGTTSRRAEARRDRWKEKRQLRAERRERVRLLRQMFGIPFRNPQTRPAKKLTAWPGWLTVTRSCNPYTHSYIPQVGDRVVYAMQGHLHYYKQFFSIVPYVQPPWAVILTLRSMERCKITKIEYRGCAVGKCCILTLELSDREYHLGDGQPVSGFSGEIEKEENTKMEIEEGEKEEIKDKGKEKVKEEEGEERKEEQVVTTPLSSSRTLGLNIRNSFSSKKNLTFRTCYHVSRSAVDYLILENRYDAAMRVKWEEGKLLEAFFHEEEEEDQHEDNDEGQEANEKEGSAPSTAVVRPKDSDYEKQPLGTWYRGRVQSCSPVDENFPESAWECLNVWWETSKASQQSVPQPKASISADMEIEEEAEAEAEEGEGGGALSLSSLSRHETSRISPWEVRECNSAQELASSKSAEEEAGLWTPQAAGKVLELVEELRKLDFAFLFNAPVPLSDFPHYIDLVHCPMDLSTISDRLRREYYRNVEAVEADVSLIATNAAKFNGPHHMASAKKIEQILLRAIAKLKAGVPVSEIALQE